MAKNGVGGMNGWLKRSNRDDGLIRLKDADAILALLAMGSQLDSGPKADHAR
jgi:hypothetical protein